MSKELEALYRLATRNSGNHRSIEEVDKDFKIIEKALKEYEAIKNAEPSEALECLQSIEADLIGLPKHVTEYDDIFDDYLDDIEDNLEPIKQALIQAEKEHNSTNLLMQELDCKDFAELRKYARCGYEKLNKQYLKWEDLVFNIEKQMMTVLLNGTKYTLIVGRNVHIDKLAFLRNGEINYYFLEADKQFFNDLRLERVEE